MISRNPLQARDPQLLQQQRCLLRCYLDPTGCRSNLDQRQSGRRPVNVRAQLALNSESRMSSNPFHADLESDLSLASQRPVAGNIDKTRDSRSFAQVRECQNG